MKRHIYFLLFISLFLVGCEDILDKYPLDKLSPTTYFKTRKELELYSNSFYTLLPDAEGIYRECSDDVVLSILTDEVAGLRVVPDAGDGWDFTKLRDINFLLENINNCQDYNTRIEYEGLAKFFRAYFYFEKLKRYGEVPWYGKVLGSTDPDLYKPRDSRNLVMDSIIADIDYAIHTLPEEKNVYRVTKWTALALKSRLCLFEGTFRKYHNIDGYETYLDQCISASSEFLTTSPYKISKSGKTPYQNLFARLDADDTEIILAVDYNSSLSLVHYAQNFTNSSTMGKPGMSKRMVNSYLMNNGQRFTDIEGYETMEFAQECKDRDPRLAQTIRTPGYTRIGETKKVAPNLAYTMTGYHITKYTLEPKYDGYKKSESDLPVFRAAEVYLNYAEAAAERGTLTQEILEQTTKPIRERVGMPNIDMVAANANPDPYLTSAKTGYPNVKGANQGVILEIRRERNIELFMEGFRYYDIIRWKEGKAFEQDFLGIYFPGLGEYDLNEDGIMDICLYQGEKPASFAMLLEVGKQIELSNGTSGYIICHDKTKRTWNEERDYLYPIPIRERSLTGGALTQNPGWVDGLEF